MTERDREEEGDREEGEERDREREYQSHIPVHVRLQKGSHNNFLLYIRMKMLRARVNNKKNKSWNKLISTGRTTMR